MIASILVAVSAVFLTAPPQEQATDPAADTSGSAVTLVRVEGPITPATHDYIRRALAESARGSAQAFLLELDTPGGLLESTRRIVQAFFEAETPVIVYVTPAGARAASAGTFITLAADVAAMAPSTTIGAASPVSLGVGGAQVDTVAQSKAFNYAASFIESIAQRRDRNVEWAVAAVRDADAATEGEALELEVIDLVAEDGRALLEEVDGMVVDGDTLRTADAEIRHIRQTLSERILGFVTRPELMLILTMIAIYGIMGEVTNPGGIVPGLTGVIALVLLLYASAVMPVNTVGYVLLGLAVALFVAEAFTASFGLLLAAGAVAFFLGGMILFQDLPEALELSWGWLIHATVLTTLFFVWIVTEGLRAQLAPARTGVETLVGREAAVVDPVDPEGGRVLVDGEYWNAVGERPIPAGSSCRIEAIEGLTMHVRPTRSRT